jgi:hypothetical protein
MPSFRRAGQTGVYAMKILVSFLLGLVFGAVVIYFVARPNVLGTETSRTVTVPPPPGETVATTPAMPSDPDRQPVRGEVRDDFDNTVDRAGESIREGVRDAGDAVSDTARRAGDALSEVTADARITATIKARLIGEPNLSALKIDVDTDNGVVTLSGTVESAQQADRAVELARTVEGVTRVASVLQIDPD